MPLDAQNKIMAWIFDPFDYTVRRKCICPQPLTKFVYRLMMAGIDPDSRQANYVVQSASLLDFHPVENFSRLMRIGVDDLFRGDT